MNDKQQLAAMGEHVQEEISWRNKDAPNGLKRFMTEKQYKSQSAEIRQYYEPYRCAKCIYREFKVPDGWKLVPVDVSLQMQHAYFDIIDKNMRRVETDCRFGRYDSAKEAYRAMLAAAPEYKP